MEHDVVVFRYSGKLINLVSVTVAVFTHDVVPKVQQPEFVEVKHTLETKDVLDKLSRMKMAEFFIVWTNGLRQLA
jgi:hypothetical protein